MLPIIHEMKPFICKSVNNLYTGMMNKHKVLIKQLVFREDEQLEDVIDRSEQGEKIASAFKGAGLPVISAYQFDKHAVQQIGNRPCLIIPWFDGRHIPPEEINRDICLHVGQLLATMHKMARSINLDIPHVTQSVEYNLDWMNDQHILNQSTILANAAIVHRDEFVHLLRKGHPEPTEFVLSHRDMNPNNLLECNDTLMILDWELAGWSSPLDELVDVGLEWCRFCQYKTDIKLFTAIVEGYGSIEKLTSCQSLDGVWQRLYSALLQAVYNHLYNEAEIFSLSETERIVNAERYILQYEELKKYENIFSQAILSHIMTA